MKEAEMSTEQRRWYRCGKALRFAGVMMAKNEWDDLILTELRVLRPKVKGGEFTVMLKGQLEGTPLIAWSAGYTVDDAIVSAMDRYQNAWLKWKEDKFGKTNYWSERSIFEEDEDV